MTKQSTTNKKSVQWCWHSETTKVLTNCQKRRKLAAAIVAFKKLKKSATLKTKHRQRGGMLHHKS